MTAPILIGGNGHSGTRIFAQILEHNGVFMGIPRVTRSHYSHDLYLFDLLDRWVGPYLAEPLDEPTRRQMESQFRRRLRLLFPVRPRRWGWKNPRSMLLLPFYHRLFPELRFIHVIRDGRDITLGNELAVNNPYATLLLEEGEQSLRPEERMILFWGRSNQTAMDYGQSNLDGNYLFVRWESLCQDPEPEVRRILTFCNLDTDKLDSTCAMVQLPRSIGRWKQSEPDLRTRVVTAGGPYLKRFGYADLELQRGESA